ncbi:T9SS type A sorting domain-containing protein [Chryseobacterium tructae]|nr:T9SS type A sorting domain-containing protein [Chryseobacterium tructae]MDN3694539.1 T9SS type A sorting domain-containing protein [Chryseobacterium tructae]
MIINNGNIIVRGNGHIVKYLLSNGTLSTVDTKKEDQSISFENPIQQQLVYQSKDKVSKIVIYSPDGRIIKTVKDSRTSVSDLSKGSYVVKVTFENGNSISKKLIKN